MSPSKGVMNGPRSPPLRMHRDSHGIHKLSITDAGKSPVKRPPVIIYTHSPKVIHAHARDFMTLVQKLTGLTRDESCAAESPSPINSEEEMLKSEDSSSDEKDDNNNNNNFIGYVENNSDTASVVTDDHLFMGDIKQEFLSNIKQESPAVSPMYNMSSPFLVDPPHFVSNSNDFFCSATPNSLFQSPNSITPSFLDYMNAFPDY